MAISSKVPSDNFQDLLSDVQSITQYMNGEQTFFTRAGREITPIPAQLSLIATFIRNTGFQPIGSFSNGGTINSLNQIMFNELDGNYYNWQGALPKNVTPGTDPRLNIGPSAWVQRDNYGESVRRVNHVKQLANYFPKNYQQFSVLGFYDGSRLGGGFFYFDLSISKSMHNGGTIIAPEALDAWDGSSTNISTLLNWSGVGSGCFVRIADKFFFEDFGAQEGMADASPVLNAAFKSGHSVFNKSIQAFTVKSKCYVPTSVSNVTFDGGGAQLVWDGVNVNDSDIDRTKGIINLHGAVLQSTSVSVTISKAGDKFTNQITFVSVPNWVVPGAVIKLDTPYNQASPTNRYNLVCEVNRVDGNVVSVNDFCKYDYSGTATLSLIEPLRNVHLKGFKASDLKSSTHLNAVSGISVIRTVGVEVSDVDMDGMYNPVVVCYASIRPKVKRGRASNAKNNTGGRGYYVQFGDCRHIEVEDLFLIKGRHVVDFTACGFATVKRCGGIDNNESEFSLHGQYEHDITYEDCQGSVGVAISGALFGKVADDITFKNVKGDNFFNYDLASNVTIEDCDFRIWSTNCFGFTARNSKATEYARFNALSERSGFEKSARIYGGFVKAEDYNGANFIRAGKGIVQFIGTYVESLRASNAIVNMDQFKMIGGTFKGGFMTPRFKGVWEFIGTVFDGTSFELNNNVYGGAQLILANCSQINSVNTGLIRNRIPSNGIRNPSTEVEDLTQRFTVSIIGGSYGVTDQSHRVMDFDQPSKCLNINIQGTSFENGLFTCDYRFPTSDTGDINLDIGYISTAVVGNILTPEDFRHKNTLSDLNLEFGSSPRAKNMSSRPLVTIYELNHTTASAGFLAFNYPLDDQARGVLKIERYSGSDACIQTIYYVYPGRSYHGQIHTRSYRSGVFTTWKRIDNV